jgi:redox-sensitive bicupin YhaK (pirin superfamily)
MTAHACPPPDEEGTRSPGAAIERLIVPSAKDIGDFEVRRVLPAPGRRSVGPFIFFDQMGPAAFPPGRGINVRPHPHVCLATITYLFEGEVMHRDSLGSAQLIRPGAVNLMTAGRGIVHSERAGPDLHTPSRLHGIQSWIALPQALEEIAPAFEHYPADEIPEHSPAPGLTVRVVMGSAWGLVSPVRSHSPVLYLDVDFAAAGSLHLPRADTEELAVFVATGRVTVHGVQGDDAQAGSGTMAVLAAGTDLKITAPQGTRAIVIGGAPLGPRRLWWNFVASDPSRIERAKRDWREGRFGRVPGDEEEFIPLPGD